ncbi:hypothetical protein [Avibacterium paragallinarum]|uniref:hypothetical protein n=1 Tax=Avibacterium paragallinarum TaxID=728 RepID=UPI00227F051C|nr:hypothetical protein [Avibacterium paragallinarum]WAL56162.1 hypothetical protein OY678_09245 [Avibacterium paragallinarum]
MKITYCKLKKSIQKKLLEFFVAEVTARTAANLLDIQPNTAALFYHKIRLVIGYHLSLEVNEIFEGEIELDESYFGGHRKDRKNFPLFLKECEFRFNFGTPKEQLKILRKWCEI